MHRHNELIKKAKQAVDFKENDWAMTVAPHYAPGFTFRVDSFGIGATGDSVVVFGKGLAKPVPVSQVRKYRSPAQ